MKSIKYKILVSFCSCCAVVLFLLGCFIFFKIDTTFNRQSVLLSADLTSMATKDLVNYSKQFDATFDDIKQDIDRLALEISRLPDLQSAIDTMESKSLGSMLDNYRTHHDSIDYAILFDLHDKFIASAPSDHSAKIDIFWLENYYQTWGLKKRISTILQNDSEDFTLPLRSVTVHSADFLTALALTDLMPSDDRFLDLASAKIITNDFAEPVAVLIVGKIINNYDKPLQAFSDITGLPCVIYLATTPIAHTGFVSRDDAGITREDLLLSPETLNEVNDAGELTTLPLTVAGTKYLMALNPFANSAGDSIGIIGVGMAEENLNLIRNKALSYGKKSESELRSWLLVIAAIALLLFTALSLFIAAIIVRPITKVTEVLQDISEGDGDVTARIDVQTSDETGRLAKGFNIFVEKIQAIVNELGTTTIKLSSSSEELSSVAANMTTTAEEMSTQTVTVAGTTEQMSASINSIASASEQMSENIQSISVTAEQMSHNMNSVAASIEEMTNAMNEIAERTHEGSRIAGEAMAISQSTSEVMAVLGTAAEEIGEVTHLIKKIAGQTNLLALNATIEAASAGDAGKGFAVVANEIKELALQSTQAAENIANRIQSVQSSTEKAVNAIGSFAEIIDNINTSSESISDTVTQQSNTATEISASVQQATDGTDNIAAALAELTRWANDVSKSSAEAANGINEVSANFQGVSEAAGEAISSSRQVKSAADELARMATVLQQIVSRFKA